MTNCPKSYYFESQVDKSIDYGHCMRISVNNALQKFLIRPRSVSVLTTVPKTGGSIKWGRWSKATLVAVCQKEQIHINNLTKKHAKFRKHTYYEICRHRGPLLVYGQPRGLQCNWNHCIATRDGLIFDPDATNVQKLSVQNLHSIFTEIFSVYSILK